MRRSRASTLALLMPRPSHLSPDNILRFLQVRRDPASTDEIARGLHVRKADRRPLIKMLAKLEKEGRDWGAARRAVPPGGLEARAARRRVRDGRAAPSRLAAARRARRTAGRDHRAAGFAPRRVWFCGARTRRCRSLPATFSSRGIPSKTRCTAIAWWRKSCGSASGPGPQRAEGRIVRVLGRAHPTVVGQFRYGSRGNSVLPYDARMQHAIEIPPGQELTPELAKKLGFQRQRRPRRAWQAHAADRCAGRGRGQRASCCGIRAAGRRRPGV